MNHESISGSLQENLLTLLCFDVEAIPLILNSVELGLFENKFYRTIAEKAQNFYTSFKRPIGEHLPDTLEKELAANDEDAEIYEEVIFKLHDFKDSINRDYVIGQLTTFIREQSLKAALTESVKQVQAGNIEKAEQLLNEHSKKSIETFNAGLFLSHENFAQIFKEDATEVFRTNIKVLDKLNIGLARGELFVILAPANSGKTNFLIHLGKAALTQRLKVLHVTLEMSEEKIIKRYLQSFYSMTKRPQKTTARYLETNELGKFSGINSKVLQRPALSNKNDLEKLQKKVEKYGARTKVLVKQFPTSSLTIEALELYMDSLETFENFIPDVLLLDYPDLMKLDSNNLRESTGRIYKELRGIAVKRNIAVAAPSQSNRAGEDAKIITLKHFAEDYSKAAIADNVIGFCVHGNQRVVTNKGLIRIKSLQRHVDTDLTVLSHNFNTGKDEWKLVTNWWSRGKAEPYGFLKIKTSNFATSGKIDESSKTTPEHKYFTPEGVEIQAKALQVGQLIAGRDYVFTAQQEQVILGTLLGDGYLNKSDTLVIEHGERQKYYVEWKKNALGQFATGLYKIVHKERLLGSQRIPETIGWTTKVRSSNFKALKKLFYKNGKRVIPENMLEKLTPLGLAIWFMDDGCIEKENCYVTLSVNAYKNDKVSKERLVRFFESKGWKGRFSKIGAFSFNAESSRKIIENLKDFLVPDHSVAGATKKFLLPEIPTGKVQATSVEILSIETVDFIEPYKYDIEVEDNHNFYLSNGALCSNSQTADEYNLGLARLFVAKARDEQKFTQILITQSYEMGQFCLSSVRMEPTYWKEVEALSGNETPEPTEEPRTQRRSALKRPKPKITE